MTRIRYMKGTRKNLILKHDPSHKFSVIPKIIFRQHVFGGFAGALYYKTEEGIIAIVRI